MLKHNPFVSCNINNTKEINDIVKASCVTIMPLTRSVECELINKSPLPTTVASNHLQGPHRESPKAMRKLSDTLIDGHLGQRRYQSRKNDHI